MRPTEALPRVATTAVGAVANPTGVTALDGADRGPLPNRFTARTWRVYVVPLTRPVTVPLSAVRAMPVRVTTGAVPVVGVATIAKLLIAGAPATAVGPVQETVALPVANAPAVAEAVPMVGAPGTCTSRVWSENFNASTLRTVSMPSLTFWPTTFAPVWVTVTLASSVAVAAVATTV